MINFIDHTKAAIKDHRVFNGLCCDDRASYADKFMQPDFYLFYRRLLNMESFVVFQVKNQGFIFHLVNFTEMKTKSMTELFINNQVIPYCKAQGLKFIQATAERKGMARKLERMGFVNIEGNTYRKELSYVS